MHPVAFERYLEIKAKNPSHWVLPTIEQSQHFFIGNGLHRLAWEIARHEASGSSKEFATVPATALLPAKSMILTVEDGPEVITLVLVRSPMSIDRVDVTMLPGDGIACALGAFWPGRADLQRTVIGDVYEQAGSKALDQEKVSLGLVGLGFILSLINHPAKISWLPQKLERQQRRRVERTTGQAADGWVTVGWEIGKAIARQGGNIGVTGHRKALHWRRGHFAWSPFQYKTPSSVWLESADYPAGWYLWKSDTWCGHPDYGVRLNAHQPKLSGEKTMVAVSSNVIRAFEPTLLEQTKSLARQQAGFA